MGKRKNPQAKALQIEISDPDGLSAYSARHLEWLAVQHYSQATIRGREHFLGLFLHWCQQRDLRQPQEITRPILESYQRSLHRTKKINGKPVSANALGNHVYALRGFFKWLAKSRHILYNPAAELEIPKRQKRLPRYTLTVGEVEQVLAVPDTDNPLNLRDRAILETLYSTGIRRAELIGLHASDLDYERKVLAVRQGKGNKDRIVPIGERAIVWIQRYLDEVRPEHVLGEDEGTLFLNKNGKPLDMRGLSRRVGQYVKAAEIGKDGACHLFRHTVATLMLENGADIRYIQEILGHASVKTTQIYTQVSIHQLRQVYSQTHPAANLTAKQRERMAKNGKSNDVAENGEDGVLLDDEMDLFDE
jgi:integrase/recombinase XerD